MYAALPPEVNTGRLIAGAMAEPYLQAATGWQMLATQFSTALSTLTAEIASMAGTWQGMAAEQAQAAFAPYLSWMGSVIALAQQRSAAAAAQAAAYTMAVATTPTLAEIAQNHLTTAMLHATNFLGVNAIPLAANEFQYAVVLWNRASGAMFEYQAATALNTTFVPFPPAPPIMSSPGAPQAGLAAVLAKTAAALPNTVARDALLTALQVESAAGLVEGQAQLAGLAGANAAATGRPAARAAESQAGQQFSQLASQAPQMLAQVPQQAGQLLQQGPQQLMQLASQPMQQLTSLFQQGLGGPSLAGQGLSAEAVAAQFGSVESLGMYGTSPVGSGGGAFGGAGLLSAGGGGSAIRVPTGWAAPLAPPGAAALPGAPAGVPVALTSVPGSGVGAAGSGAGMLGPLAAARSAAAGAQVAVAAPVVEEAAVAGTLGFEAFDEAV